MKKAVVLLSAVLLVFLAGCSCDHVWAAATCTEPMVCTKCDEGQGEALGHQFESATCKMGKKCIVCGLVEGLPGDHSYIPPTCTEPSKCSYCGEKRVGSFPLRHDVDNWTILAEPTCSAEGERSGFCTRCNSDVTESIAKLPHTDGEWEITAEATWSQAGKKTLYCSVCNERIRTEDYSLSESEIKSMCVTYTYEEIARYPDKHKGELATFKGEVIQVISDGNKYVLRVNVTYNSWLDWYEDTIYVTYTAPSGSGRILEDDIITMYGVLAGEKTYETIFGGTVTIPSLRCLYIEY